MHQVNMLFVRRIVLLKQLSKSKYLRQLRRSDKDNDDGRKVTFFFGKNQSFLM